MTNDRQIERLLDSWLAEGPTVAPDRAIDGVAARITRQAQRPAWRLQPWRFPTVNTPLKLVLIGAALLVAVAAGSILISGGRGLDGGVVEPTLTPAPTPTPTPTVAPTPANLPNGNLAAGTYVAHPLAGKPMTWTVTVPDRWTGSDDWFLSYDLAPDVHSVSVGGPTENESVPTDSCAPAGTKSAASVDEFIAAARARGDWTVSAPVDVTVSGYSGKRIDLEVPAGATCDDGSDYMVLVAPDGNGYRASGPDRRFRLWILDIDGKPIVIFRLTSSNSPADRVAEADAIVETGVITP